MDKETRVSEEEERAREAMTPQTAEAKWDAISQYATGWNDCMRQREAQHSISNITPEKMEEFKNVVAPAVKWFRENCNPHQRIIIDSDLVVLASDDIGIPLEIPD